MQAKLGLEIFTALTLLEKEIGLGGFRVEMQPRLQTPKDNRIINVPHNNIKLG
jgi:hypothetical protein